MGSIVGMPREALESWFQERGEKPFRARQLMRWMYGRDVFDPSQMTDLSLDLRTTLEQNADFSLPEVTQESVSADGTIKWLVEAGDSQHVEMVFIPEPGRGTFAILPPPVDSATSR